MKTEFNEADVLEQIKTVVDQINKAWSRYCELVGDTDAGPKPRILSEEPAEHMQGLVGHLESLLSERDCIVDNVGAIYNELGNKLKDLTSRTSKFTLPECVSAKEPAAKAKAKPAAKAKANPKAKAKPKASTKRKS